MDNDIRIVHPLFYGDIAEALPPVSPKDLEISPCHVKLACNLNAHWHSRLPVIKESNILRNRRQICYAADYDGLFYAVAIWSDPVAANRLKDGDRMLELRRMAIAEDAPFNTASRMISVMVKDIKKRFPDLIKLVSYQDTEVHNGTIYKASGWINESVSTLTDWSGTRKRDKAQSDAPKVRWARQL